MIVCGIDPGVQGGVAFIDTVTGKGWGDVIDTTDGAQLACTVRLSGPVGLVAIEIPSGRPPGAPGGYQQILSQGRAIGVAEGVVLAMGLPLMRVSPKEWTKIAFKGHPHPKVYAERKRLSLRLARERWPMASLGRAKDQGVADALWIALVATTGRDVT